VIRRARVLLKLALRWALLIPAFCRDCGRDVHDYHAPDAIWARIWGGPGGVLCYDCFCERCRAAGLPAVWRLEVQP
jgi:hypothetical protein